MLNVTPIMRLYFQSGAVCKTIYEENIRQTQCRVLSRLIRAAADTEYGKKYGFRGIETYSDFAEAVPLVEYPDIRPYVMRMVAGESDILWKGVIKRFAQSSGTSDGKSKYIPITPEGLSGNHYRGSATAVARYLAMNPASRLFAGKAFILGGSFASTLGNTAPGVKVGDLSAHLIDRIPEAINLFRIPSRETALLEDWRQKVPCLVRESVKADVTNISGVPSWFLTILKEILAFTGQENIHRIWPGLEVFFHGGISFRPYRHEYEAITDTAKMHYVENYNASEGFFAVQDTENPENGMELLLDCGVFYEFVPLGHDGGAAVPAWEVRQGSTYALAITTANGLWRYMPGDTVRIESTSPLRISVAGRTKNYINAFGEELMVHNADDAIAFAAQETSASVSDYTAAPVYATSGKKGRHQWIIEFAVAPDDMKRFTDILDSRLQQVNSDYQAKRTGGIFLAPPEVTVAPAGTFGIYLARTGRLGGQRKVPRLSNDRHIADTILNIINNT